MQTTEAGSPASWAEHEFHHYFFMETEFDALSFTSRMRLGEFDGNLLEIVSKLSTAQLEKVADILMALNRDQQGISPIRRPPPTRDTSDHQSFPS